MLIISLIMVIVSVYMLHQAFENIVADEGWLWYVNGAAWFISTWLWLLNAVTRLI